MTHLKENIQPGLRDRKFSNQEIVKMKASCEHLERERRKQREHQQEFFIYIQLYILSSQRGYDLSHASQSKKK